MSDLKISEKTVTLVDHVESKLFKFITTRKLKVGDAIPNENELAEALGVSRSVLREALSRLRMLGVIESRTRRGMVLCEPNMFGGFQRVINPLILGDESLINLLGFRIALELGICSAIIENITDDDIAELDDIVKRGPAVDLNFYKAESEYEFHSRLYEVTDNQSIIQFQELVYPVTQFVHNKFQDYFEPINRKLIRNGQIVTHDDILHFIKNRDKEGLKTAMERHFEPYNRFLTVKKTVTGDRSITVNKKKTKVR